MRGDEKNQKASSEGNQFDFRVDKKGLYREEAITDLRVASIRRMVPVHPDGTDDPGRTSLFYGHTQLLTPQGPLPLQVRLMANSLSEAIDVFPAAMEKEVERVVEEIQKMQAEEERNQRDDSRIILPGR
ncbi:cytoplasmic protein [Desulfosarcina sp. OttesenSCG-928-A07]|nr:cytoplasmic protein [Desulfosarcina sp. OttesenSCG-928-G17]MDL2329601.1 cytoplasmic protein [Desulfosarcina sp. OttesenSCG-928-A07]